MTRRAKHWTCRTKFGGTPCLHVNSSRKRNCGLCGRPRPARRRPAHLKALDVSYEQYAVINGGEECGICGTVAKPGGRRLHRDHDHRTGEPRGLLCFRCNAALRPYMTTEWLLAASAYVIKADAREAA